MIPHPDVTRFTAILFEEAKRSGVARPVFEVRILKGGRDATISGYFDDPAKAAAAIAPRDGTVEALYMTPNPTNPDCFARSANKLKPHANATTTDAQIVRREWFLIDVDPVRPKGVSSTDVQHRAALDRARAIRTFLDDHGFPPPLFGDSGNGAHLMYRIDLPNDPDVTTLIKRGLEALGSRFDDAVVKVDTTSCNAARIWKIYGTMACKGDNLPEQPHRRAALLDVPSPLAVCNIDVLRLLASMAPTANQPAVAPSRGEFDLMAWLRTYASEFDIGEERQLADPPAWVREISPCPWGDHEKDRAAFVGRRLTGELIAGCRHDRCKDKRWVDLRTLLEPDWNRPRANPNRPPPHTDDEAPASARESSPPALRLVTAAPAAPGAAPLARAAEDARRLWGITLPPALSTGIGGLDRSIVGLRSESIVVLNGPPGRGKSGLVIQVARHIAAQEREVVYLTSELSARQVLARVVAQIRHVPWLRIYELGPSEAEAIARDLAPLRLRVIEIQRGQSIRGLLDRVADEVAAAPVLILDYLQHVARRLGIEDQRMAVGQIADQLVTWARDTHSCGMVVSSVARTSYVAEDGAVAEDFLAAGKDAGEIEYDASAVLFLAAELAPQGGTAPARLHVSKHRFGASGQTIGLVFDAAIGMFRDDPQAALTDLERQCYTAIANGARTANDVFAALGGNRKQVLAACRSLCRGELVEGPPMRVRGGQ